MKNSLEKVKSVISQTLKIDPEKINVNAKIEDICVDSIQIFSLIMAFEKEFKQKVEYNDLIRIETVGDIVKFVEKIK